MHRSMLAVLLASVVVSCGDSPPVQTSAPAAIADGEAAPASQPGNAAQENVQRELVDACAGFTLAAAAEILGVAPGALVAETGWSDVLDAQRCHYWSPESNIGPGVEILLQVKESPAEAAEFMARLRHSMPAESIAVRRTFGVEVATPMIVFDSVGHEAMWDSQNQQVTVRVGNVIANIQASASSSLTQRDKQAEIELERRIGVEIAEGLGLRP